MELNIVRIDMWNKSFEENWGGELFQNKNNKMSEKFNRVTTTVCFSALHGQNDTVEDLTCERL